MQSQISQEPKVTQYFSFCLKTPNILAFLSHKKWRNRKSSHLISKCLTFFAEKNDTCFGFLEFDGIRAWKVLEKVLELDILNRCENPGIYKCV